VGGLVEVASGDAGKPRRMCRMAGAAFVEAGPPSRAAHAERVPAGAPLSPATTRPAPGPLHRSGLDRDRTGCANHPPVAVSRRAGPAASSICRTCTNQPWAKNVSVA